MDSENYIECVITQLMEQLGIRNEDCKHDISVKSPKGDIIKLSPQKALVLIGLILDVLSVQSIVIGADKNFSIVLNGTLAQKSKLDNSMEHICKLPFDQVMKSILKNL